MTQQNNEVLLGLSVNEQQKVLYLVATGIDQIGSAIDIWAGTPLRDIQVFLKKTFNTDFGPKHPLITTAVASASIIANLPFLAKIINENETDLLHDVLRNIDQEYSTDEINRFLNPDESINEANKQKLITYFNDDLNARGIHLFEIEINNIEKRRLRNLFQKRKYSDIRYIFCEPLKKLLGNANNVNSINFKAYHDYIFFDIVEMLLGKKCVNEEDVNNALIKLIIGIDSNYQQTDQKDISTKSLIEALADKIKFIDDKALNALFGKNRSEEKDIRKNIATLALITPLFYRKDSDNKQILQTSITIGDSRKEFIKNLNKVKFGDITQHTYNFVNDASFNFWLAFFILDMVNDNSNATNWSIKAQLIAVTFGLGIAAIKSITKAINYFTNKFKQKKYIDTQYTETLNKELTNNNKSLKHQQLVKFFIEQRFELLFNKLVLSEQEVSTKVTDKQLISKHHQKNHQYYYQGNENKEIIEQNAKNLIVPKKSLMKRFLATFFSKVKTIEEYEDIIKSEAEIQPTTASKVKSALTSIRTVSSNAVVVNFIEWFASIASGTLLAASHLKNAAKKVDNFFGGTISGGFTSLSAFATGLFVGVFFDIKARKQREIKISGLKTAYESKITTFDRLKQLQNENIQFTAFLKQQNIMPFKVINPVDDRGFRRITSKKTKIFTAVKKVANRLTSFVGKVGTGILIFRLTVMTVLPLFAKIAILAGIVCAASTAAWPVGVAALALGLIWGGFFLYEYIQQRKIENAERLLNDVDNRLLAAEKNNILLRKQLGLTARNQKASKNTLNQSLDVQSVRNAKSEINVTSALFHNISNLESSDTTTINLSTPSRSVNQSNITITPSNTPINSSYGNITGIIEKISANSSQQPEINKQKISSPIMPPIVSNISYPTTEITAITKQLIQPKTCSKAKLSSTPVTKKIESDAELTNILQHIFAATWTESTKSSNALQNITEGLRHCISATL